MKKNVSVKTKRIRRGIGIAVAILCISGGIVTSVIIAKAPDIRDVNVTPDGYLTTILDQDGNVMRTIAGEEANRVYVTLDQIPLLQQQAFIAIEDARFYSHRGVDVKGIARAAKKGITSGHFSEGASTITQQLLKNNVFKDWMDEETFADRISRKVQEQYLAIRLEQNHSKEWILENYLNTINLGGGSWGVEAASKRYYGKDVAELNLAEMAMLAGITKNPSGYNPLKHPESATARQHLVLEAMRAQDYISEEAYEEALAFDILADIDEHHSQAGEVPFSYFEDALLEDICQDLMDTYHMSEEAAWNEIYRGGLTIYSTEESTLQAYCERVAAEDDYFSDGRQVSMVVMANGTGEVKAIIGGSGAKTSSLTYNRAIESIRQPGSALKVIGEYAACLDHNLITLGTTFDDAKMTYSDGTAMNSAKGVYSGMTTVRYAIAKSLNTVALKCYQKAGPDLVMDYLERFGITTLTEQDKNEALAIGGTYNGVTNLELTAAYHSLANQGIYVEPHFYTKVVDHEGGVLLEAQPKQMQAVDGATAMLLTSALEDVLISGTGTEADFNGIPLAGKTGTTNKARDTWFVGYSPYYTCGIWGGYDDNSEQKSSSYVKKVWKDVMKTANADCAWKDFDGRDSLVPATICTKCGKLALEDRCSDTLQGNMTKTEMYRAGTVPTSYCDCHQVVVVCRQSGQMAGAHCPLDQCDTVVYLKNGTLGTADEAYVIPASMGTCEEHVRLWDQWFEQDENDDSYEPWAFWKYW